MIILRRTLLLILLLCGIIMLDYFLIGFIGFEIFLEAAMFDVLIYAVEDLIKKKGKWCKSRITYALSVLAISQGYVVISAPNVSDTARLVATVVMNLFIILIVVLSVHRIRYELTENTPDVLNTTKETLL